MERLKELRVSRGISQQAVADALGMSRQAYGHYEAGSRDPSNETVLLLADYFNVTTDFLLGRTDDPEIKKAHAEVGEEEIKVALFGGDKEVSDKAWDEVLSFVEFVKQREKERHGES